MSKRVISHFEFGFVSYSTPRRIKMVLVTTNICLRTAVGHVTLSPLDAVANHVSTAAHGVMKCKFHSVRSSIADLVCYGSECCGRLIATAQSGIYAKLATKTNSKGGRSCEMWAGGPYAKYTCIPPQIARAAFTATNNPLS